MEHTPLSPLGSPQARQDYSPSISVCGSSTSYLRFRKGVTCTKGLRMRREWRPRSTRRLATRLLTPPVVDRSPGLRRREHVKFVRVMTWKLQLPDPSSRAAFVRLMTYQLQHPWASDVALSFFDRPRMQSSETAVNLRRSRDTRDTRSPADQPKHLAAT